MSGRELRGGVLFPFVIVTLIWSSTWIVIRDQLGIVPPAWSVCYRFAIAAFAMAVFARMTGVSLRLPRGAGAFAALLGIAQFALNFNLLYRAEAYLTSGLCALVYALLMAPNSLFAWIAFGQKVSRGFILGSLVAAAGIGLLFVHEYRAGAEGEASDVLLGLALCTVAVLCASVANVMQASPFARTIPTVSLLAWAMAAGALVDGVYAWTTQGPPVFEGRPGYWLGTLYLAIAGSVITFPLYFGLISRVGAGPAAYTSLLIPILAMLISTVAEDYRWNGMALAGVALALGGMALALRARLREAGPQS
jgi:drug/metabolite transporter (DMT)-like permease